MFVSDEVNQLFDTGQQCRLEVCIGADGRQDALPRVCDVGLGLMRPAQLGDDPMFPGLTPGNDRPAPEPEALRSHGLPHVDIRAVSYTHLRAHETDSYLVCRLLLETTKKPTTVA